MEVNCETDFVARGDKFKELVADVAMQIAASSDVTVVSMEDVPAEVVQKETDIELGKEDILSKPEQIRCVQNIKHCSTLMCIVENCDAFFMVLTLVPRLGQN